MNRLRLLSLIALTLANATAALSQSPSAPTAPAAANTGASAEAISQIAASLIADAIPRKYERTKDWGQTKQITTGLRSYGNFFRFDIDRNKTAVNHGVWKAYRVTLVEPEKNLNVQIQNLRTVGPGRISLTLLVTAKLDGWARAKVYNRGVHIIAVEAEGDTVVHLSLDADIAFESVPTSFVPGIAIRPQVTNAKVTLEDFNLRRVSDMRGSFAHELGKGLRHVLEDELEGPKLVAKLNQSIDKRRDKLTFTPDKLLGR